MDKNRKLKVSWFQKILGQEKAKSYLGVRQRVQDTDASTARSVLRRLHGAMVGPSLWLRSSGMTVFCGINLDSNSLLRTNTRITMKAGKMIISTVRTADVAAQNCRYFVKDLFGFSPDRRNNCLQVPTVPVRRIYGLMLKTLFFLWNGKSIRNK